MDDDRFSKGNSYTTFGDTRTRVICNVKWTIRELVFCGIGITCLVLFVVAIALLGVGIEKGKDISTKRTNVTKIIPQSCLEPQCLETSATLVSLRNTSVDPCDNFYAYACSSKVWSKNRLKDEERELTIFHGLREENEKRIENILGSLPSRSVDWSSEVKMKNFYQSCLDTYGNSVNGPKNFINQIMAPAGGWQAIGTMDERTYSITAAMKKVHIDFWQNALFQVSVGPDWIDQKRNVVQVSLTARYEILSLKGET